MYGVSACQDGTASRSTHGRDIVTVEDDSTVGQGVNVGSGDLGPMEPHIIPALQQSQSSVLFFCITVSHTISVLCHAHTAYKFACQEI